MLDKMEILDNDFEQKKEQQNGKAPRVILLFLLTVFFSLSSFYKKIALYFSIKDLPSDQRYYTLDWPFPSGDFYELVITTILLFFGVLTSLILVFKYRRKLTSKIEWTILLSPLIILILHLVLQFISSKILYSLI